MNTGPSLQDAGSIGPGNCSGSIGKRCGDPHYKSVSDDQGSIRSAALGTCLVKGLSHYMSKIQGASFIKGGFNARKGPFCVVSRDADVFACHYSHTTPSPSASFIYGYAG